MDDLFNPRLLDVNRNPLQRGDMTPELLREATVPPKGHHLDTRWVMDVTALEELLRIARQSPMQRVVVHQCSVRVRKWRDPGSGHVFETYTMLGQSAEPETLAFDPRGERTPGTA